MSYLGERINWQRCRRPFPSDKSDTLNPERIDKQVDTEADPKMILLTASRAKKKLRQTAVSKIRALSSSSTRDRSAQFSPNTTISKMIRDRHHLQDTTHKLQNAWGFISQRFQQQNKKRQFLQKKQERMRQTIRSNQSFKSFVQETVKNNNHKILELNKQSKTLVVNHRKSLYNTLNKVRLQKTICGQIGRKESQLCDNQINQYKTNTKLKNKIAFQRGKSLQQKYQKNKRERFDERKKMAEKHYREKWMKQYIKKQKAQRQNKIRSRVLTKKIQNLLKQTDRIRQNNMALSQSFIKK